MKTRTVAYSALLGAVAIPLASTSAALAQTELQPTAAPATQPAPAATAAPAPAATPAPATAPAATAAEEPPTSKMDFSVAPPPAPLVRNDYMHNGLYVRVSAGPGAGFVGGSAGGNVDEAFAFGLDAMVGGSPSNGLSIGGAAITNVLATGNGGGFQYIVGPYFDAFPNPRRGGHFGAMVGLSGVVGSGQPMYGAGGSLYGGVDWWVGPNWSSGILFRGTGGFVTAGGVGAFSGSLLALISIVYN